MKNITNLNYGQIVLYGFLCTSIESQSGHELSMTTLSEIIDLILELTDLENYDNDPLQCPDVQIMTNPEKSFEIFCDFYDENENYFVSLINN
jgi:hypothetical protein